MSRVIDQAIRNELLTPARSFIVQAPAGSGKTELLTQRILNLLSVVEKPENILAITFTRKAAAEMRSRVISALILAQEEQPEESHEIHRWRLAKSVLERDKQKGWNLIENASRINTMTIDSLSASLSSALPLLSQTGALPDITENAWQFYREAADNLTSSLSEPGVISDNILTLLKHKDNNLNQVNELLAQMLSRRLQWMTTIGQHFTHLDQDSLLNSLQLITEERLQLLFSKLPVNILCELPAILNQASDILIDNEKVNKPALQSLHEIDTIGSPLYSDLKVWKAIAELFLKAGNSSTLLTTFNVRNGFPVEKEGRDDEEKQRFKKNKKQVKAIAIELSGINGVAALLQEVKLLPENIEQSLSQQSLGAIVALLPVAVAHLKLVFSKYNAIDFSELSLASLEALGHPELPSDLALAMDYKLEHILIDEFQDTSTPQMELIKLLTAGWEPSAGRTLFLVGDPMQSIYRFRDANVALFMKIRDQGIGDIQPEFRQLRVNFRSTSNIVNWINTQFSRVMPEVDDMTYAAVSYARSTAFNQEVSAENQSVKCFLTVDAKDKMSEANKVVQIIQQHVQDNKQKDESQTLAVLARSRASLAEIIQLLNRNSIEYQAVEIDRLSQKMVVSDLTSLAFALCDVYDELSWAACMRSPWFGLNLDAIHKILTSAQTHLPMPEKIQQMIPELDNESAQRCEKILPLLMATITLKGRKPFRKWLSGCFDAVGGFYQLDLESDREDFLVCLDKLSELQQGNELNDRQLVIDSINNLFAATDMKAGNQVQVMTIHKSKGLEFDKVILPALDGGKRAADNVLLKWAEVIDSAGNAHNLIAVSRATGGETDGVFKYISHLDSEKDRYENQRLLYVAATRAKRQLFLTGNVNSDIKTGDIKKPIANSFLSMLWNGVEDSFIDIPLIDQVKNASLSVEVNNDYTLQNEFIGRQVKQVNLNKVTQMPDLSSELLDSDGVEPEEINPEEINPEEINPEEINFEEINFEDNAQEPVSELASVTGTVLHRQLQWICERYSDAFILPDGWRSITYSQLKQHLPFQAADDLEHATDLVMGGISRTLKDKFGRWMLSQKSQADSELVLHKKIESGGFLTRIVDRTFVDNDVRWIIDYKSSQPEKGESRASFLAREKAVYMAQLTDYFKMFARLESRKIVAGLYFPLLSHFETVLER